MWPSSPARSAEGRLPSLVFPALESGRYELFEKGRPDAVALWVEVTGGVVTTADWPLTLELTTERRPRGRSRVRRNSSPHPSPRGRRLVDEGVHPPGGGRTYVVPKPPAGAPGRLFSLCGRAPAGLLDARPTTRSRG